MTLLSVNSVVYKPHKYVFISVLFNQVIYNYSFNQKFKIIKIIFHVELINELSSFMESLFYFQSSIFSLA